MDEPAKKRQKLVAKSTIKTEIKDLPDDLVIEILCRLPHHKYVFQCKCISKRFFSLITRPCFIHRFVTHLSSKMEKQKQPWAFIYVKFLEKLVRGPSRFLCDSPRLKTMSQYSDEFKSRRFSLEFLPPYKDLRDDDQEPITIIRTFNDLILCCVEKFDRSESTYYICNPQTEQWVALPPTPPLPPETKCHEVEFICRPYYYKEQGRVIVNSHFKFKVLRFLGFFSSEKLKLQVFSSKTGRWDMFSKSVPPYDPNSIITRSLICKKKRMIIVKCDPPNNRSFSVIFFNRGFKQRFRRVNFPGSRYCISPFHSVMHLSSQQRSLHVVQICMNIVDNQPNYGVPVLRVWKFDDRVARWELRHKVSFRNIASQDKWISNNYLKKWTFILREHEEVHFRLPITLGFHPSNDNFLYLNLNCPKPMGFYDMKNRSLNFVSETWCCPSLIGNKVYDTRWSAVSEIVLPLWPTPIPQISQATTQPEQTLK
ncbi:hypothetical protein L6164_020638 [Bauhinia variegata]|uniref:Uncharacterized protein n=1 Tax=Bauhinia variegata TaxID=167791 RepID=A0ACB9MX65_BAUVA|nr:hypothetical protein L6164_020638 [Bauhinia variegata]